VSYPDDAPGVSRREALLRLASAATVAAAMGAGAFYFHDRRLRSGDMAVIPDWRMPGLPELPAAVAARGANPAANVRRAMAALGGMERFVHRGEKVVIKPNVGWDRIPEQAANTDPTLVAELVRLCLAAGASHVVVTDNSCNDPRRCFARSGILEAASAAGASVVDASRGRFRPAALSGYSTGLEVLDDVLRADRVINVPVVKHHSLSRATLGMKNWMGALGTGRNRLHQGINRAVAELGAMFRPTLTVMDATRVLLAGGPQGGSLADVKTVNAIAIGLDPVACEAWGAAQMGLDPRTLGFITEAEQRGLGRGEPSLVKDLGTS
jgi:uncharacterized protein (DUF362 family)